MDPEENEIAGLREAGNIDLHSRPILENPDGSISTVRSMSFGTDQGEVLIPTVGPNGEDFSEDQAIQHYRETGQHLGIFDSPDAATAYAQTLHERQAQEYVPQRTRSHRSSDSHSDGSIYRLLDQNNQAVDVSPQQAQEGLANGSLRTAQPLRLRHSSGRLFEIPADQVAQSLASGQFTLDTPEQQEAREIRHSLRSAPLRGITAASSVLRGLDFGTGLTEALIERPLGIHEDIEALREANPDIATAGEVGGALLTALPTGGESLLGRVALAPGRAVLGAGERLGGLATRSLTREGAGLLERLGARTIGGAIEGTTQAGLAEGAHILTEEAYGEDPGDISDRLFYSMGLGAVLGGGAHGATGILHEAGSAVQRTAQGTIDLLSRQFQNETGEVLQPGLASLGEAAIRRGIPISQVLAGDSNGVVPRLFGEGGREARQVILGGQSIRDRYIREMSEALTENAEARHVLGENLHGSAKENAIQHVINAENVEQQQQIAERLTGEIRRLSDTIDQSARTYGSVGPYGPRAGLVSTRLRDAVSRAEDEIQHALTADGEIRAAEIFSALDRLKASVGEINSRARGIEALEGSYGDIRSILEDENIWGGASALQRETNEALSREINWSSDFERLFMRPGEAEGFDRLSMADTSRVARHLNGAGSAANLSSESIARDYIQASNDLADAVIRHRATSLSPRTLEAAETLRRTSRRLQELYSQATRDIQLQNQAALLERNGRFGILNAGGIGVALGGPVVGGLAMGVNALANPVRTARILGTFERLAGDADSNIRNSVRSFLGRARETVANTTKRATEAARTAERMSYSGVQAYGRRIAELERHRDGNQLINDLNENTIDFADSAPRITQNLQRTAARATQYLLAQIPRGGNPPGSLYVSRHRLPSTQEMQRFLRIARTIDHPKTVIEDLKNRNLTPESVQALRTIYPRLYSRIVSIVGEELAEKGSEPSYQERLQLGILLGIPTDYSLTNTFMNTIQQMYIQSNQQVQNQIISSGRPGRSVELSQYQTTNMEQIEFRRIS